MRNQTWAGLLAMAVSAASTAARAELPTLESAVSVAKERALLVTEAQGEVGAARAALTGASVSAIGNPYVDIQVDRPVSRTDVAGSSVQALTFTYIPVDLGGQRSRRIDEANRLVDWKKQGVTQASAFAAAEAVAAYGELLVSYARISESKRGEAAAREEAAHLQGRFDAKDATLYDTSLAEAEVARWVQSRAEAELRVSAARARLGQLTGWLDLEGPVGDAPVRPPTWKSAWSNDAIDQAVSKAPSVTRLLAERNFWQSSSARYEREAIPPVSFEVIAGRGGQGEARLGLGAVLTAPATRRYQGEIARAEQGALQATRQADAYRTVMVARMRAARDSVKLVEASVQELDQQGIPALERAVSTSLEGFRAGKIDLSRAMLARRDLATARARRLDLIEAGWRAHAEFVLLTGELP